MDKQKAALKFGDDIIGALDNWGEKTLAPVSIILGEHVAACQRNRDQFKANDIDLTQAHASACSALLNLISRNGNRKGVEIQGDPAKQFDIIAHFVQGINLCEVAIVEGLYVQAATLLRQEHEMISAIQELGIGRRKDGKTPHATIGVLKHMGRAYSDLTGGAHVSQSQLLHSVIAIERDDLRGPSIKPLYHRDLVRNLYSLHVCYIVYMARLAGEVGQAQGIGGLSDDETRLLTIAIGMLEKEGLIQIEAADLSEPIK